MCGISAIVANRSRIGLETVQAMTAPVRHRGPDDEGFVVFSGNDFTPVVYGGNDTPADCYAADFPYSPSRTFTESSPEEIFLALGHRRLSIVDLSPAGHQPMCTADKRYWIVYNGEVYNHIELREELRALGHAFHSHSDTEVILAAYKQWEGQCLARFNGMFAFVLFDRVAKKLFVARDRFGVKPLYYWISPDGLLAFASEIKQFTVLPGWQPRMNGQRAYDFLNWSLLDHTAETLFAGVFQLRNGEALDLELDAGVVPCLLVPGGKLPTYQWYTLRPRPFSGSLEGAAREFRVLFRDSVRLKLRADVPVGSCLSGGLDSSSIVCVMNSLLREQDAHALQKTFSACAEIKRFDEREFIDEVVRHTDTVAHYVYPSLKNLFANLDAITWHQDEPFGSSSIYAQWHVFKLAAENGVKVMLDGQGADEQLAGYHSYFGPVFARLFKIFSWLRLWREIRAAKHVHGYSQKWAIKQTLNTLLPEPLRQPLRRFAGKPSIIPEWLNMATLGASPVDPFLKGGGAKADSVQGLSYAQLTCTNLQMLLHWEDRDSMAHSIEARVPFLDYRLVEFLLGLPDEFKLRDGITKQVLREGMRGILPERVRTRMDKLGFVTPEEVWVREQNPDQFRMALREAVDAAQGIVDKRVFDMLEKMILGSASFNFLFWRLISFGAWIKKFGVR